MDNKEKKETAEIVAGLLKETLGMSKEGLSGMRGLLLTDMAMDLALPRAMKAAKKDPFSTIESGIYVSNCAHTIVAAGSGSRLRPSNAIDLDVLNKCLNLEITEGQRR